MRDNVRVEPVHDAPSILTVLVLYKLRPDESRSLTTFMASLAGPSREEESVKVFLYDNTPDPGPPGPLPSNAYYEAPGKNAGLASAYNRALDIAQEQGFSWLLLLDQDSVLPTNFLELLWSQIREHERDTDVVAIVPIVRSRGVIISPQEVGFFGLRPLAESTCGVQDAEVMAINSGTAVRCEFVRSIGGFNGAYWLDYLDHWLFRQIYKAGKKVAVLQCILEHQLSVQDYQQNVSLARYRSILAGESAFTTTHKSRSQLPFYLLRLVFRSARLAVMRQPDKAMITIETIAEIMRHSTRSLENRSR